MTHVISLEHLRRGDLPTAGGKAANLGELIAGGFPVPPGFCITTAAYRAFTRENDLEARIRSICASLPIDSQARPVPAALEEASAAIRVLFTSSTTFSPALRDEILAARDALGQQPLAVRSSATAEDLPDLSFAGQQDTYLNVVGDHNLLDAVLRCWSSLWTARAIGYRIRAGISHADVSLAVVVQIMVPSEASGVLFTANPLTGRRTETVIDATLGLGEALVSGQVDPDHYVVGPSVEDLASGTASTERIIEKTLGEKAVSIRGQAGGGTCVRAEDARTAQALPDDVILSLTRLGRRVEAHFGTPQDIEWAWADSTLCLVQSRPITSLYPLPDGMDPLEPPLVLFSLGAVQGMLDPITPLGRFFFSSVAAGLSKRFDGPSAPQTQHTFLTAGERLFINLTGMVRSREGRRALRFFLGVAEPVSQAAIMPVLDDPRLAVHPTPMRMKTRLALARTFGPVFWRALGILLRPEGDRDYHLAALERVITEVDTRLHAAGTPLDRVNALQALLVELPLKVLFHMVPLVASGQAGFQQLLRLSASIPGGREMAMEISRGTTSNVTTQMDLALWDVSRQIYRDPASRLHFEKASLDGLVEDYRAGKIPAPALAAVEGFLRRYGMRGPAEIDIGRPRWRDDPLPLFQALQNYLRIADPARAPDAVFARGADQSLAAEEKLVAGLLLQRHGRLKAALARLAARRTRALVGLRETPKFAFVRIMGLIREMLIDMEQQLLPGLPKQVSTAGEMVLHPIFFLTFDELQALAAGEQRDWAGIIAGRHENYTRELRRKQIPRLMLTDGTAIYEQAAGIPTGLTETGGSGAIPGSPVSPGVVEGAARVILNPRGAHLEPGEILVCPATDPGWTPLFLAAGGLVMEMGGMMTHGSVVAREYGIPAVVGVVQATTRIRTGQRLRVDGTQGTVYILQDEPVLQE